MSTARSKDQAPTPLGPLSTIPGLKLFRCGQVQESRDPTAPAAPADHDDWRPPLRSSTPIGQAVHAPPLAAIPFNDGPPVGSSVFRPDDTMDTVD
ncbi:hypothetical protein GUJ93_ZPchr0007g3473 [Zizania palustris]|uniref:Uncharacterized protein n=1 Tax=Zizania palustris TaxID=103762 RepID=A0A8J5TGS4_ZIZPA|nr:hypothetical protein GUJ93_ZPchr0007g3473 [Zizania palustris]KAG8081504.1 hypothetical protein GUJ93_ZPchr0007g3473 [Zizania palustris]